MKLTSTHKVIGALAVLGIASAYGKKKYDDYNEVVNNLKFEIDDISNVRMRDLNLLFDVDILFENPTNIDFSVNGLGLIAVKKVKVFRENVLIGEANSNVTQIEIPANGSMILENVPVQTKYLNFLTELSNLASYSDLSKYSLEIEVDILGQTYVIEQPLA